MSAHEMLTAIKADDVDAIQRLVSNGYVLDSLVTANVPIETVRGSTGAILLITALDYAVSVRSERAVALLLDLGSSPDVRGSQFPALFWAAFYNRGDWATRLLGAGADPSAQIDGGITPIMMASAMVSTSAWTAILRHGASLDAIDDFGRTVLFYACRNAGPLFDQHATHMVRECIDTGIDVNAADVNKMTALHVAAAAGPWATDMLLAAGADPHAVDANGRSALMYACRSSEWSTLKPLLDTSPDFDLVDNAGWTAAHYAVHHLTDNIVRELAAAGAALDRKNKKGRTPLMLVARQAQAAGFDARKKARILMEGSADPSQKDVHGNNVWHHLTKQNSLHYGEFKEFVDWRLFWDPWNPLEEWDTEWWKEPWDSEDGWGATFEEVSLDVAKALLEDADGVYGMSEQNTAGNTPLMFLAADATMFWEAGLELIFLLLSRRVDLLAINNVGDTVLTRLCTREGWAMNFPEEMDRLVKACEALCNQGADVNARNFAGQTALSLANSKHLPRIVQVLRRFGATSFIPPAELIEHREPAIEAPSALEVSLVRPSEDYSDARAGTLNLGIFDASIFDALASEATDDLLAEFAPVAASPEPIGEDAQARQLHSEAYEFYKSANSQYQSDGGTFPFISLTSGKRTVQTQVRLYRKYIEFLECNGPRTPAANKPGVSPHNFGMAIDVVRGSDEAKLNDALTNNGWVAAVEDEGWHFEAQDAASWEKIQDYMASDIKPLSDSIAQAIVNAVLFKCYIQRNEAEFRRQEQDLRQREQDLRRRGLDLRDRRVQLNRKTTQLNNERAAMTAEENAIRGLRNRLHGMVFDRCPNNQDINHCTHYDLIRQWRQERQDLVNEINTRDAALRRRRAAWQVERQNWMRDDQQLRTDERDFRQEETRYRADKQTFETLKRRMAYWERERRKNESEITRQTPQIQSKIDAFTVLV